MLALIFGCGYLGTRVAARWRALHKTVHVATRSPERAAHFRAAGYEPLIANVTDPATLTNLPEVSTVLYAVGFDRREGKSMHEVYVRGLEHVLEALPKTVRRFIYISSTGVYGDYAGAWVDEDSPCTPQREGGQVCHAAERLLAAHPLAERALILRMGGIYGPGRLPRIAELRRGEPIAAPATGWLNLIHVDDAAEVVLRAEEYAGPARTLLVADGTPVQRGEYLAELARIAGAPPPRFMPASANDPALQRAAFDKRISAARMRSELAPRLRYPSYREGLAASIAADGETALKTPPADR